MKKLFAGLAMALMALSVTAHAKDYKTVRFGVDASYPPFESKAADGSFVGFDIDLGNAICAKMHAKCVWVPNDFDGMIPALKARKFDGILSSMSITEQREKEIDFSSKLFNVPARMIAKKGSTVTPDVATLQGKTVGVEQGTTQETYAKTYWAPKGVKVVSYQNQDQVYTDLLSGRLDASFQDEVEAQGGFLSTPKGADFAFAGSVVNDPVTLGTGTGIGLRKTDTALKAKIDKAIKAIIADGTYKKLAAKYFDFDVYGQ
jgi:lysine/arginine/ornithine transport system substrate-binding protein